MLDTALAKKRLVGLLLAAVILALFLIFNRFPKLDTVQGDLEAVTGSTLECFQSFCIDRDPDSTFFSRWWEFSLTYLRLVSVGMVFAFVVAGLTEAFLFPNSGMGTSTGQGSFKRTLKGLAIGPVMNLCSACIVPISSTFRRTGVGIEGAISMVQGSATLNIPSLVMVAMVFTPLLGVSRLVMGVAAALLIGPLVVMVLTRSRNRAFPEQGPDWSVGNCGVRPLGANNAGGLHRLGQSNHAFRGPAWPHHGPGRVRQRACNTVDKPGCC